MKKIIALTLISFALVACGSKDSNMPDRPGQGGSGQDEPEYDYSGYLADPTTRADAAGTVLRYGDAGVLYIADTSVGSYSYINVDNASRIDFTVSPPSLKINSLSQPVVSCTKLKRQGATTWYALELVDGPKPAVIVVEDF